jgi:putative copper export protein
VTAEYLRLSLHVLAATVWVGGQLVLAALVPALRRVSPEAPAAAAQAFARVAWPAFGVLLLTGAWNTWAVRDELEGTHAWLYLGKIAAVVLSGVTAAAHERATTPRALAMTGAATGASALLALLLGVRLTL